MHIPQESSLQIFSPGVHAKFSTFGYSPFCACWVHTKYNLTKIQLLFKWTLNVNFSTMMILILPLVTKNTLIFGFHTILALFRCQKRLNFPNFSTKVVDLDLSFVCAVEGRELMSVKYECKSVDILKNNLWIVDIHPKGTQIRNDVKIRQLPLLI